MSDEKDSLTFDIGQSLVVGTVTATLTVGGGSLACNPVPTTDDTSGDADAADVSTDTGTDTQESGDASETSN